MTDKLRQKRRFSMRRTKEQYGPVGKLIFSPGGIGEDGKKEEGRWQIVDRKGMEQRDYSLHNGDVIKVKRANSWIELQAWSDGEEWVFCRASGRKIDWSPREFPCKLRVE
jgi:hypothetical protein